MIGFFAGCLLYFGYKCVGFGITALEDQMTTLGVVCVVFGSCSAFAAGGIFANLI